MSDTSTFTAFAGPALLAAGDLLAVARAVALHPDARGLIILRDADGRPVDLDMRDGPDHAVSDYHARTSPPPAEAGKPGRGRPKLGVVAREVTLLPRHWDWLATQPGGASAALRRLVEEARKSGDGPQQARTAQAAAYHAMSALAGDLPDFEEASRALFAGDLDRLSDLAASWPPDIGAFVLRLARSA